MADGRITEASLVGKDALMDIALLRIDSPMDHEFLRMGASGETRVGDWVMAIGSPFGLDQTVTVGVVSAKGRSLGRSPYDDYIQIDAAINPGNSGGPLINTRGEVIGINSSVIKEGQGIGFAIPIDLVKNFIPLLKTRGRIVRSWLGLIVRDVNLVNKENLGLGSVLGGALVLHVIPGSPAEKYGIQPQDVVIRVNNQRIKSSHEFPRLVARTPAGRKIPITLFRKGALIDLEVVLEEIPEQGLTR